MRACQLAEDWAGAGELLGAAGERLAAGGAAAVVICTNLMHKVAPEVEARAGVPLLHIADAVADRCLAEGRSSIGLLGTRWVMEEDFYRERLERRGLRVLVPDAPDCELVDQVVFDELTKGVATEDSRAHFTRIIGELGKRRAEAVAPSCTEIEHLYREHPAPLPLVDSMAAHAAAIAAFALEEGPAPPAR